jgi:hypothetical protein
MQRYLDRMLAREVITQEQYDEATRERPEFYIPAQGDPPLRPPEPELPPDFLTPFLEDLGPLERDSGTHEALEELRRQ